MYNKLLLLVICIVFSINIQTVSAQADEKWLPSSIEIKIQYKPEYETMSFYFKYDDSNRLIENNFSFGSDLSKIIQCIKYDLDNKPIEILKYESFCDSVGKRKKYDINYLNDQNIEITCDSNDVSILFLDEENGFLRKIEQISSDSTQTKYVTTTLEYLNNILCRRTENSLIVTTSDNLPEEGTHIPSKSDVKSQTYTYTIDKNKKSLFENISPRWLAAFLKLEDLTENFLYILDVDPKTITYYYNEDQYPTGWTVIDHERDEEVYCKIEYIKVE